jgi:hypothetical protein
MQFDAGLLILVWYGTVACKAPSVLAEGMCLLQLSKVAGEVELAVETKEKHDQTRDGNPRAPVWDEYPSELANILEEMVVTRWHGSQKEDQSEGLASPIPGLLNQFDCVRHHAFEKTSAHCQTLLVEPGRRDLISRTINEIQGGTLNVKDGIFVAFFGDDSVLSEVLAAVLDIGSHFQRTYFEGYDVENDGVDVLPIGLSEYYLRFQDWDVLSNLAEYQGSQSTVAKDGRVLAAYGAFWPEVTNPSRKSAGDLCSAHGEAEWLHCGEIPKEQWWSAISSFSFVLNPTGNGVQSTKFYEALLARAVPICTKEAAFVKLHEKGWPIVLVDSYTDVPNINLTKKYAELRPRLESVQPYLHVTGYWNYLLTGQLS